MRSRWIAKRHAKPWKRRARSGIDHMYSQPGRFGTKSHDGFRAFLRGLGRGLSRQPVKRIPAGRVARAFVLGVKDVQPLFQVNELELALLIRNNGWIGIFGIGVGRETGKASMLAPRNWLPALIQD